MRVFISYSSRDGKEYAKSLYDILSKRGHDPYLIDHDILAGENIWDDIAKELNRENRGRVIFLITPSSMESEGQKQEYDLAVARYMNRTPFVRENAWEVLERRFAFLLPYKAMVFRDSDFVERCEELSAQLVSLQDREGMIQESEGWFEALPREGLDEKEIEKCIGILDENYQKETVIPEIVNTRVHEKEPTSIDFAFIGLNYHLPKEWFMPNQASIFSNDLMFLQFGRGIALGEQRYFYDQIFGNEKIASLRVEFSPEGIIEVVEKMRKSGYEPNAISVPIKYWIEMHRWARKGIVKYSNISPRPRLDASLNLEGLSLKIVPTIGDMPRDAILLNGKSIRWHVKRHSRYGALHITFGNDRLYPRKYVQLIAGTMVNCEIKPEGITILKFGARE